MLQSSIESGMQGRGGMIMANYRSLNLELIGTKGVLNPSENYGIQSTIFINYIIHNPKKEKRDALDSIDSISPCRKLKGAILFLWRITPYLVKVTTDKP